MLYYQTKFGCKLTSSLEDTTEMVIIWLYKTLRWPWHWTKSTNFSARHSGLWWCISIPGLVTKCFVVQKILSRQTFTTICRDLDLEHSNPFFPQDSPAYDAVLSNQVWLETDQQFKRYSKNSHILVIKALAVTLTLKIMNQFFPHDTSPRDNTPPYQVW